MKPAGMDAAQVTQEHRVLILAPRGRDASLAAAILAKAGMTCHVCAGLADLTRGAAEGAGAAVIT